MLRDFIIIAQSNIPISTAAHTHYVNVTFPIFFKIFFQNLFGPLLGAPGNLAHYFRISLLPLCVHIFFPTFWPPFSLPSHGTTFHLLLGLVNIFLRSKVHVRKNPALYYFPIIAEILLHQLARTYGISFNLRHSNSVHVHLQIRHTRVLPLKNAYKNIKRTPFR